MRDRQGRPGGCELGSKTEQSQSNRELTDSFAPSYVGAKFSGRARQKIGRSIDQNRLGDVACDISRATTSRTRNRVARDDPQSLDAAGLRHGLYRVWRQAAAAQSAAVVLQPGAWAAGRRGQRGARAARSCSRRCGIRSSATCPITRGRGSGRRHPYLYGVAVPLAIAVALLWAPPSGMSQTELLIWLIVFAIATRFLIALHEIPSSALLPELTRDYHGRTTLVSIRWFFFTLRRRHHDGADLRRVPEIDAGVQVRPAQSAPVTRRSVPLSPSS